MDYNHEFRRVCMKCGKEKPVEEFEIIETVILSSKYCLGKKDSYEVHNRSYTCKTCGTTDPKEWLTKWKNSSV